MKTNVTPHFTVEEFACHDGTPYPVNAVDDEDSQGRVWFITRLLPLCQTLEVIRSAANVGPLHINSGYRTLTYDAKLYEKSAKDGSVATPQGSQHPRGRAADIIAAMYPAALRQVIVGLFQAGKLPYLGGLGIYPTFIHVDVRPRVPSGHIAQWSGKRSANNIAGV